MESRLIESFSKNQKFSSITILRLIVDAINNNRKFGLQEKFIREEAIVLGVSFRDCELYLKHTKPHILENELKSLDESQKDLLISMVFGILCCEGRPIEREYLIAEKALERIAGIDNDKFSDTIEKIIALGKTFLK